MYKESIKWIDSNYTSNRLLNKKNVQRWSSGLAIFTTLTYTFCGGLSANTEHPAWYPILTAFILQNSAVVVSALLCLRNGLSRRMSSDRNIWFLLGCALISYLFGNLFFNAWESVWGLNPSGSLGDPFYSLFYLLVPIAMLMTIVRKKVRLEAYQWAFLVAIGSVAGLIVVVITILMPTSNTIEAPTPASVVQSINQSNSADATAPTIPAVPKSAPQWVTEIDNALKPHATNINYFYVWSDVLLFCLAAAIVMGLWGSKVNRAWIVNAFAIVCFYISDIWFAYASTHMENYQSGFCLEIFWTLGSILFGLAAANDFDLMLIRQAKQQELDSNLTA